MKLYAWKISASDRPAMEGISTLEELQALLDSSDLPRSRSAGEIITQTRIMEHEGQGVYRHRESQQEWNLLWVALGSRDPGEAF